jgi:hypothetical protein
VAGILLNMGLGGSALAGGYPGSATPAAAGVSPQGPTVGTKAFGIVTGSPSVPKTSGYALISGGTIALGLLVFIWWSLPR